MTFIPREWGWPSHGRNRSRCPGWWCLSGQSGGEEGRAVRICSGMRGLRLGRSRISRLNHLNDGSRFKYSWVSLDLPISFCDKLQKGFFGDDFCPN